MAKKFSELRARMSPKARAQSEAMTAKLLKEMPLQELRQVLDLTQQQVAETLKIDQAAVSKMEKQTDMYLSTLAVLSPRWVGSSKSSPAFRKARCGSRNSEMSMRTHHARGLLVR